MVVGSIPTEGFTLCMVMFDIRWSLDSLWHCGHGLLGLEALFQVWSVIASLAQVGPPNSQLWAWHVGWFCVFVKLPCPPPQGGRRRQESHFRLPLSLPSLFPFLPSPPPLPSLPLRHLPLSCLPVLITVPQHLWDLSPRPYDPECACGCWNHAAPRADGT